MPSAGRNACRTASLRRLLDSLDGTAPQRLPPLLTATVGQPIVISGVEGAGRTGARGRSRRRSSCTPAAARHRRPGYHRCASPAARSPWRWRRRAASPSATSRRGERLWGVAVQIYGLRGPATAASAMPAPWRACRGGRAAGRRCRGAQPGAQPVPRRSGALRPLFAVEPAVPQSAADRSGDRAGEHRVDAESRARRAPDRLADARRREVRPAAPAVRRFPHGRHAAARRRSSPSSRGRPKPRRHARFEARNGGDPRYHLFLQWLADGSFAAAQQAAKDAGMRIGLISDLAIGMDRGGSQVGADPDRS